MGRTPAPRAPRLRDRARSSTRARGALARLGIEALADRSVLELSGGERQLVMRRARARAGGAGRCCSTSRPRTSTCATALACSALVRELAREGRARRSSCRTTLARRALRRPARAARRRAHLATGPAARACSRPRRAARRVRRRGGGARTRPPTALRCVVPRTPRRALLGLPRTLRASGARAAWRGVIDRSACGRARSSTRAATRPSRSRCATSGGRGRPRGGAVGRVDRLARGARAARRRPERYGGKGVRSAVANVNGEIARRRSQTRRSAALAEQEALDQRADRARRHRDEVAARRERAARRLARRGARGRGRRRRCRSTASSAAPARRCCPRR